VIMRASWEGGDDCTSEGTVIQWASPGLSSLPGHDASLDEQRRDGHG
jgi:hypothetical protein